MKCLKISSYLVLIIAMLACAKEEYNEIPIKADTTVKADLVYEAKSSATDFELLAKATGLREITYTGSGYDFDFYRDGNYSIDIVSFDANSLINIRISKGALITDIEIDPVAENIAIGTTQISFKDLEQSAISESQDVLLRICAVVTVHHLLNPNTNGTFTDNGSNDIFPEGSVPGGQLSCFWCKQTSTGPCIGYAAVETTQHTVFWIFSWTTTAEVPCNIPTW